MVYRFEEFELDTAHKTLRRDGEIVRLRRKAFEVLCHLVLERDRVVLRDELCELVWPGRVISDATLSSTVWAARKALDDIGDTPRWIVTSRGYGYMFRAPGSQSQRNWDPDEDVVQTVVVANGANTGSGDHASSGINGNSAAPSPPTADQLYSTGDSVESSSPVASSDIERKLVTVLCMAIPESIALVSLDLRQMLQSALDPLLRSVAEPFGGEVRELATSHATVIFGSRQAQEDHAQRAARAALELQRRWPLLLKGTELAANVKTVPGIGLSSGHVAVQSHTAARGPGAVIGEPLDLAAALAQRAEAGTIVGCAGTAAWLRDWVALEPIADDEGTDVTNFGKAYRFPRDVAPSEQEVRRQMSQRSVFVGREEELALLHRHLVRAEHGQGQAVRIVGEAGSGKSRLLEQFQLSLATSAVAVLVARCESWSSDTPYLPISNVLRRLCGLDTSVEHSQARRIEAETCLKAAGLDPRDWSWTMAPILGEQTALPAASAGWSARARQARMYSAWNQLIGHYCEQRPLVLVVENVHWIDASSEAFLAALQDQLPGMHALLLMSSRLEYSQEWTGPARTTQLALPPLSRDESQHLAVSLLPTSEESAEICDQLVTRAQGNPFFLEELADAVRSQALSTSRISVPSTIEAVLSAHIDRLTPAAKQLLQRVAVIGNDVPLALIHALNPMPETALDTLLNELQAAGLLGQSRLLPEPIYSFKHVLTHDVTYGSLMQQTRERLHGEVAQILRAQFALVADVQPELLAHHLTEAGDIAEAVSEWKRAGEIAARRNAYPDAIRHIRRALDLTSKLPESKQRSERELEILMLLGPVLVSMMGPAIADLEQYFGRARELAKTLDRQRDNFAALWNLWRFYNARAAHHRARRLAHEMLISARQVNDPAWLQASYAALGTTLSYQGKHRVAKRWVDDVIAHELVVSQQVELAQTFGATPHVRSRCWSAWILWFLGHSASSLQNVNEASAAARKSGDYRSLAYAQFHCANLHVSRRDAKAARAAADELVQLATEQDLSYWLPRATFHQGWAIAEQGEPRDGITQMKRALDAFVETGAQLQLPMYLTLLATEQGMIGDFDEGLERLLQAEELAASLRECFWQAEIYRCRGEVLLQSARAESEADACFRRALTIARRQAAKSLELRAATSLARLWCKWGRFDDAHELLSGTCQWFARKGQTVDLVDARRLLAQLSRQ